MPFNGSGTFNRLYSWVVDAANSVNISSSRTDAEMNGFAAGLTNCITRDGQSPPSADIPWGAKKITNLANATVSTDALNMATGDARYLGAVPTIANAVSLNFTDASGTHPHFVCQGDNNLVLVSTDASGNPRTVWGIFARNGSSAFAIIVPATALTPTVGDNSSNIATTSFVATALAGYVTTTSLASTLSSYVTSSSLTSTLSAYAGLFSPTFTGTPVAPTAAAGTATTQLATTAFVDGLRDVPSNAQTANYALALTDRGKGVDFNGTSLTCTIPANASVAFPVGSVVVITNLNSTSLSIAITTDTLTLSGTTTTGTRTLGQNGEARLRKVTSTSWLIAGTNLS